MIGTMKIADTTGHVTVIQNVDKDVFEKTKATLQTGGSITADIQSTGVPTVHALWPAGHIARLEWSAR